MNEIGLVKGTRKPGTASGVFIRLSDKQISGGLHTAAAGPRCTFRGQFSLDGCRFAAVREQNGATTHNGLGCAISTLGVIIIEGLTEQRVILVLRDRGSIIIVIAVIIVGGFPPPRSVDLSVRYGIIDRQYTGGGTNFVQAFSVAMQVFKRRCLRKTISQRP